MKRFIHLMIILLVFLTGCGGNRQVLDEIIIVTGMGFDLGEDDGIIGTINFPVYQQEGPPKNITFTVEKELKRDIIQEMQRQSPRPIRLGTLEVILFGKEMAEKKGIVELVDVFQRDPAVGSRVFLIVVDGKAQEILEKDLGIRGTNFFISEMLYQSMQELDFPTANLHVFLQDYYSKGKNAYVPQVKIFEEAIKFEGLAFFKEGKLVYEIDNNDVFFFTILSDKVTGGLKQVNIKEGSAAVKVYNTKKKFKISSRTPLEVTVKLDVDAYVHEYIGVRISEKQMEKIEVAFEKMINKKCTELIKRFQEKGIDPVGFGHFIQTQTRKFDMEEWEKSGYKDLTVKVETNVIISEAGTIE